MFVKTNPAVILLIASNAVERLNVCPIDSRRHKDSNECLPMFLDAIILIITIMLGLSNSMQF